MARYKVTGPNGKQYLITGPSGSSKEQILGVLEEKLSAPLDQPTTDNFYQKHQMQRLVKV
jgi:hypothetical protein